MSVDATSTFTWLAYSEREQREAQDLASTLSERDTRDELGVGSIRDSLADLLFPGTSTIQSRARYFFFVPWIFQELERQAPGRSRQHADDLERRLAATLRKSSDTEGLVGGRTLAVGRLPSSIYWAGLRVLGIRRYEMSLSDYFRWLDAADRSSRLHVDDDGMPLAGETTTIWDDLPKAPPRFLDEVEFKLESAEAAYLTARAESATPGRANLLALLFGSGHSLTRCEFPWEYPWRKHSISLPDPVREELEVAELFSLGHHGAALMFNLLIAIARDDAGRVDAYQSLIEEWQADAATRLQGFDLNRLWALVSPRRISLSTRTFVEKWFEFARAGDTSITGNKAALDLVRRREIRVKTAHRSRIANPYRVAWNGASGSARLDYRWKSSVQRMVLDVAMGGAHA